LTIILFTSALFSQNICFNSVTITPVVSTPTFQVSNKMTSQGDFNNDGVADIIVPTNIDLILFTSDGNGQYNFSNLGIPGTVTFATDLNSDGNSDIIIGLSGAIRILMGNGDGTFNSPTFQLFPTDGPISDLTATDLNSDGFKDIVFQDNSAIKVLQGVSPTSFSLITTYTVMPIRSFVVGNFNSDSNKDILVLGDYKIQLLSGIGNCTFTSTILIDYVTGMPYDIFADDLNNDGFTDFVVTIDSRKILSYLGNGSGGFNLTATLDDYSPANYIRKGDFNNDGITDIITCNGTQFLGDGNGYFGNQRNYSMTATFKNFEVIDANLDNYDDVVYFDQAPITNIATFKLISSNVFGEFNCPKEFLVGMDPRDLSIGDFNGDKMQDIITANYSGKQISVLNGYINNSFNSVVSYSIANCEHAEKVTKLDFNNDTLDDFYITGYNVTSLNTLLIGFFNNPNFNSTDFGLLSSHLGDVAHGDLNNDSITDLCVNDGYDFTYCFGAGNGNMASGVYHAQELSYYSGKLRIADVNNDGLNDIISNGISYYLGTGNGQFNHTPVILANINYPYDFEIGNFNHDNNLDIVSSSSVGLNYYQGTGGGNFSITSVLSYSLAKIKISDVNGDGNSDILGLKYNANSNIVILLGNGTGNFAAPITLNVLSNVSSFDVNDINGDKLPDIAVTDNYKRTVRILLNTTAVIKTNSNLNTICNNSNITLRGPKESASYLWQYSSGSSNYDSLVVTTPGIYSLTTNNNNGTCTSISTITVNTNVTPTVNVIASTNPVCMGSTINLSAIGANTYIWNTGVNGSSINSNPMVNTAYSVIGQNPCGFDTVALNVFVHPLPVVTMVISNSVICEFDTVNMLVNGANNYLWSTGATSYSISETPSITTIYSVTGTDINNCSLTTTVQISVNPNPTVSIVSTNSVCIGTSSSLTATGADSYTWSTGATTNSITESPTIPTTYSVTGTDLNNCSNTQTVSITVDNTCQDVWPGDANSDGTADNIDVLELGLHYTQTGTPRTSISNVWQSYHADNWTGTISSGKNVNHSDCNGDGIINDNDTLAIYNNYGLTHAFKATETTTVNPQLSIVPDQNYVDKGNWGTSSIYLGEATNPINNINGVAFTVNFDNTLIETNSIYIEYQNSFLDLANQDLDFRKTDFANGKIYTATTHTVSNNVSGFGKIASLHYKIKSTLTSDAVLNLSLTQANQSNASGSITPLSAGSASLLAVGASVGLTEFLNSGYVSINPNPTNGTIVISSTTDIEKVEVTNLTGQILISESVNSKTHSLNLEALANGVYFVKVYNSQKQVSLKKLVMQK